MKRILLVFLYLHFSNLLISQTVTTVATPVLKYLYVNNVNIGSISNTEKQQLFPLIIGNKQANFKLIRNKSGLYALADGSGQVYKATTLTENIISFTRIDSTLFFGNNFKSIKFSYNDTLYSFGGYGFWQMNGLLTHFNPGAEWSINKINKLYNASDYLFSYASDQGKIFYVELPREVESTFEKRERFLTVAFNIKEKENVLLGIINSKIDLSQCDFTIDAPSLKGILAYSNRDIYLYSFLQNKVYKLVNLSIKETLLSNSDDLIQNTFELDSKIYFTHLRDNDLKSIAISINDFVEEPYPLYISVDKDNYVIFYIAIPIIIIIIITAIVINIKKKNNIKQNNEKEEALVKDLNNNEFNTIESTLIFTLIEKSKINSHLTVDELNTILGIKKKTIEIQKRVRTETLNRINHKFNVNFNKETVFIERIRSVEDRRYFNYIINIENIRIYLNHQN
jgi:hypothetical protein